MFTAWNELPCELRFELWRLICLLGIYDCDLMLKNLAFHSWDVPTTAACKATVSLDRSDLADLSTPNWFSGLMVEHFYVKFSDLSCKILTKAFITYVRPLLECCTPVWSPHTVCNINKNQRTVWAALLAAINIPRLGNFRGQKNRIDLIMCYKILNSEVSLNCNFFRFVGFDLYERPQV